MQRSLQPTTLEELRDLVASEPAGSHLLPVGGKTKSALIHRGGCRWIDLTRIEGVIDYQPSDFTVTVKSGTSLSNLAEVLRGASQFMPFDPPWMEQGSTVGGMIATGINGPSKQMWGGIRDFVLAVEYIDGAGRLIRSGAKVVKNTAGFDLPKFFVGSKGAFGILVSVTLKVFPEPRGWETIQIATGSMAKACDAIRKLGCVPLDLAAVDFRSDGTLFLRIVGSAEGCLSNRDRIRSLGIAGSMDVLRGNDDRCLWTQRRDDPIPMTSEQALWRWTCVPSQIATIDGILGQSGIAREYSHAGNSFWIAASEKDRPTLDLLRRQLAIEGVPLRGRVEESYFWTERSDHEFLSRIQQGMDSAQRWLPLRMN